MSRKDYAGEIVCLVREVAPIDSNIALKIDTLLRERYAGSALHIAERAPVTIDQINDGLRARKTVRTIAHDVGLSRATIYRMLGRSKSRKIVAP